jgi:hypothetical protein
VESSSKWVLRIISATTLSLLTACGGGGSTLNLENQPAPPVSSSLSISFQPAPPSSLNLGGTAAVIAVVSNDPSNAGVDWSANCQNPGSCGVLSPLHTASGQAATYTPPLSISTNTEGVNIVAFATADHTKNIAASITVTGFAGFLSAGKYVIETSGSDIFVSPYQRAGVITLDGNGAVTGGEQTVNFMDPNIGTMSSVTVEITGGSYLVGADGRGTLSIQTNDVNIGQLGVETFSFVALSSSRILLAKVDNLGIDGSSNETSIGTLDLQVATSTPSKGYAFVANGMSTVGTAMSVGGVFNIDSPQNISGTGSAFDVVFDDGTGTVNPSSSVSGTVSSPDSFGVFVVTLGTDFGSVQFNAYPVGDGTHLKLIENDGSVGWSAGDAFSQGSATGTFETKSTFTGKYAFGIFGRDLQGLNASLAAAGLFSSTGAGTLTNGFLDESQSGTMVQISDKFHATYAVGPGSDPTVTTDPAGTGRFYVPLSDTTGLPDFTFSNVNNGTGSAWVFYLTTKGGPVLMLDADFEPALSSGLFGGGIGSGIAYPTTAGASLSGPYGAIFTQNLLASENDVVAEFAVTGQSLSGVLDSSSPAGPQTDDTSFTGSFKTSAISGRLTGTLSDVFFANDLGTTDLSVSFYPVDSTQGFFVETDLADSSGTPISGDLTLGYYATRTPICPTRP